MIFLLFILFPLSVLSFAPFHPPPPPHGHGHHPFPSALIRNVSVPARRQFFQIISSNVTKEQIETKLTGWAKDNGLQTEYDNYTQTVQQHMKTSYDNLNKWLAGSALTLYNKLWDIRQNMGITRTEECQQIHQLLEAADPPLRCLVPAPQSVIPGPPPPNCFHPFNGHNEGTTLPSLKLEDEEILENNFGNSTTIEPEEDDDNDEEEK